MNWEQEISLEPENLEQEINLESENPEQEINLESENVSVIGGDNYYDASWLFEVETASQQQYDRLLHAMAVKKRIVLASEQEVYNAIAYLDNNNNIAIVINNDGIESYDNTSYADNVVTYFIVDKNTKAVSSQVGETNGATFAAQINELSSSIESKQDKIDSSHKLASDLVDDTNQTNQFVTIIDKTNWDAKYDKPSAGIPKTDLTSTVQTSLEKADTAVQPSDLSIVATSGNYNDLTNKPDLSNFATKTELGNETTARENADIGLQGQIDAITSSSDVKDIVGTYTELQNYDTSTLGNDDIIKVLQDSTHNEAMTYYRWVITGGTGSWQYIGQEGPYYTKSESDTLLNAKQNEITSSNKLNSDLVNDENQTNKFVTASNITTWNGKYTKPNDGIPKTDLASDVQTSLGKADTAIQSSDLTNYVTNTDYASSSTAGVIKLNASGYGTSVDSSGALRALVKNYEQYESSNSNYIIGKGTLENVITGKGLITSSSDITGNASTSTTLKAFNYSRKGTSNTWAKVATATLVGTWEEKHAYLFVKGTHNSNFKQNGIISIDVVGNATKSKVNSYSAQFISASNALDVENFYIEYQDGDANTDATINFWVRNTTNSYASWQFKILQNIGWTIESANTSVTTLPTQDFTGKNAELSNVSLKAINDKNGNDITTTYVKKTDYAAGGVAGIIKVYSSDGLTTNSGTLIGATRTYQQYNDGGNWMMVCKGTLENVITGKNLINSTSLQNLSINTNSPMPNFDDMQILGTYEFDISDTNYHPIYTLPNNDLNYIDTNIVVAYRLTVTGTGIEEVADIIDVWYNPVSYPLTTVLNRTLSTSAATSGVRYLRAVYPTSGHLNDATYPLGQEIAAYNATARHIKVEVFKQPSNITWKSTVENSIYVSSTYNGSSSATLYTTRGWIFRAPQSFAATSATSAGYVSSYETATIGSGAIKTGAVAISANHFCYLADDGLVYDISNTTKNISANYKKVGVLSTAVAKNTAISSTYFKTVFQLSSTMVGTISHDTFALGRRVFLRCTMDSSGNIHSDNYLATSMGAGYTWLPFGVATASNAINMDTRGQHFYTLDSNGKLTHIDGIEIATGS